MSALSPLPAMPFETPDLRPMRRAMTGGGAEQARKTGIEFEEMFLAQMLQPMFDALPTDGAFGGGSGERMFRSFQVNEYAKAITKTGGIGIADAVTRHIISMQEKSNG
jgi:Rod binding domain-containing protein